MIFVAIPVKNKKSPCFGCDERRINCHSDCPKDARGEFGYSAWRKIVDEIKCKEQAENEAYRIYRGRRTSNEH